MSVVNVSKSTVIEDIYKNFYTLISAISGFSTIVYPAFPEGIKFDDKADFPVIIISSPEISWEQHTFGKGVVDGTIAIDIYTTSAATTDQYASDVSGGIETSKATLASVGLRMITLDSTNKDMANHGEMRVHLKTLIFKYKFYYDSTRAY